MLDSPVPLDLSSAGAEPGLGPAGVLALAVVQGLAEFLPISSSGHLVLAQTAMGLTRGGLTLDVALHVGTLVAVVAYYRRDLAFLVREALAGRVQLVLSLAVGTLPAAVVGLALRGRFEALFHSVRPVGAFLLVTAGLLVWGEAARRRLAAGAAAPPAGVPGPAGMRDPGLLDALWIGCAQALAILPGISRAGATIAVGLARGLSPESAARFSFLLSLPVVLGAALLELPRAVEEGFQACSRGSALLGMALAAGVGWASLALLVTTLRRGAFRWFAVYCAVVGVAALLLG